MTVSGKRSVNTRQYIYQCKKSLNYVENAKNLGILQRSSVEKQCANNERQLSFDRSKEKEQQSAFNFKRKKIKNRRTIILAGKRCRKCFLSSRLVIDTKFFEEKFLKTSTISKCILCENPLIVLRLFKKHGRGED